MCSVKCHQSQGVLGEEPQAPNKKEITEKIPMRNNSLPNRNATTWVLLPSEIMEAENGNIFKTKLERHIRLDSLRRSVYRI